MIEVVDVKRRFRVCVFVRTLGGTEKINAQVERLGSKAYKDGGKVTAILVDEGIDGDIDRCIIEELLKGIRKGYYEAIYVKSMDRLVSNEQEQVELLQIIMDLGGRIFSVDTGTWLSIGAEE